MDKSWSDDMQGLIFTLKRRRGRARGLPDIRTVLRRYGVTIVFSAVLAAGLLTGCLTSSSVGADTLKKLDLLFTTNMPDRLRGGALGAFCASFGSDFLFLLAAFLLGLCVWGIAGLPFVAFFKGYGIGVSAGYLFSAYGAKGVVFYLAVLLPGVCLFSMALVYELCASLDIYKRFMRALTKGVVTGLKSAFRLYLKKSAGYLITALFASVLDVLLWYALSGLFNF